MSNDESKNRSGLTIKVVIKTDRWKFQMQDANILDRFDLHQPVLTLERFSVIRINQR